MSKYTDFANLDYEVDRLTKKVSEMRNDMLKDFEEILEKFEEKEQGLLSAESFEMSIKIIRNRWVK